MSLINDALKRAKNAQQNNPPPSGVTPMRPVEPLRPERNFNLFLPVLIILLVITAIFFISLSLADHTVKQIAAAPAPAATQEVQAVEAPVPMPDPNVVIGPAAINTNPPPVPPPPPAPIQVQGIVGDPVRPWAIVNGKTVHVGDLVNGLRVTAIARSTITLAGKDGTNTLGLGRH